MMLGVNDYKKLHKLIREFIYEQKTSLEVNYSDSNINEGERILTTASQTAYLRIAEGCNNCCTYCVIPMIRGGYRSRPWEAVVDEVKEMAARGTKEIILIAQDVTEYGTDLYGRPSLPMLLRYL